MKGGASVKTRSTESLFDIIKWSTVLIFSRTLELVPFKLHMKLELSSVRIVFSITIRDFSSDIPSHSFHQYSKGIRY